MVRRPSSARALRAGFSLIELMGVIVILGLIGTVAMISWQALLPSAKLNSAIRNLSEVLAGARSEAISRNAVFEIHYDLDNESYWVKTPYRVGGGLATKGDEYEQRANINVTSLATGGLEITRVMIDDEEYFDGVVYVRFDPLGASSAHTVQLYHPMFENIFTIEVLPLTGEIRFHDGFFEREKPRDGEFD